MKGACALSADCESYDECNGFHGVESCDSTAATCDGSGKVSKCFRAANGLHLGATHECSAPEVCVVGTKGAGCGLAPCGGPEESWCSGSVIHACIDGISAEADCSTTGLICVSSAWPGPRCAIAGGQCSKPACSGSILVDCWGSSLDCGWLGLSCIEEGGAHCGPIGDECRDGEVRCSGVVAGVCLFGTWREFDCGSFNHGWCAVAAGRDGEPATVRCRVSGRP
ncbi:MAG: hypothetical protein FJ087_05090 [Deltaproteobacteria bacterium]|nr:hypothetical protein [Deltaproteobacteria bacterium]